jgi:hypothetical protein
VNWLLYRLLDPIAWAVTEVGFQLGNVGARMYDWSTQCGIRCGALVKNPRHGESWDEPEWIDARRVRL